MSATAFTQTTSDGFLGGRLTVTQPKSGFRAGLDSVLLGAVVDAHAGDRVLDAGCGVGVASLCLAARQPGASVQAIDIHPGVVDLCTDNIAENGCTAFMTAECVDVFALPSQWAASFDHVMTNPPYHDYAKARRSPDDSKALANGFSGRFHDALRDWIHACLDALTTGGTFWMINRAQSLDEILTALEPNAGAIEVLPLLPKADTAPKRVIVKAQKGAANSLRTHPGLVLHEEDGGFTPAIEAALTDGKPLLLDRA